MDRGFQAMFSMPFNRGLQAMKKSERNIPSLTRRDLLRVGGLSLVGGYLNVFRPFNVRAEQKAQPVATARQVLFVNIDGGMSQVDTLDAKEGPWTPSYFDIRSFKNDLKLPFGIMPNLPGALDKITIVRSMAAWDVVHGRAQYYIQTGHPLNLALAKEVPAIGAVVCHELAKQRKSSDSLPAFIAMNMAGNQAGLINQGFLSAEFGPMSLSIGDGPPNLAPQKGMEETLQRRWERLQQLDKSLRGGDAGLDRSFGDYHEYYRGAWAIMNDPRVPEVFTITDEDKKRYGSSAIGNSLILARNLFRADAGTRFIMASHGGWDHHGNIYKEGTRNHPVLIRELDAAFTSLIKDLDAIPSKHAPGKTLLDETLVVAMSDNRPIYMEDVACTIYSALGIDWTKTIENTPSGRAFHYVEPASGTKYVNFKPAQEIFT
jgi:hypothetical protein